VVLGLLAAHPAWGSVAIPLLARLYVGRTDLEDIDPGYRPPFRTKLKLSAELMRWAVAWLGHLDQALWVFADGAYGKVSCLRLSNHDADSTEQSSCGCGTRKR
jgi:hypothetical protein